MSSPAGWGSSASAAFVPDSDRAAVHFVQLAAGEVTARTFHGAVPMPQEEIDRIADAGVMVFLRANGPGGG